jgi:hypothetical protein
LAVFVGPILSLPLSFVTLRRTCKVLSSRFRSSHFSASSSRARALSELAAGLADRDPEVVRFRDKVLGGSLLTLEEPDMLITVEEAERFLNTTASSGLVRRLVKLYDWDEAEAKDFVLFGETPEVYLPGVQPINYTVTSKTPPGALEQLTIHIAAASWVPARAVEQTYRWLQWGRVQVGIGGPKISVGR